jgi:neutral amino acid transport system ATP-binding protein
VLGAVLVPVGFEEITRFISNDNPSLPPNLLPSLQWVAIGLLIAIFLWARPQGVLPERRRVVAPRPASARPPDGEPPLAGRRVVRRPAGPSAQILTAADLTKDFGGVHAVDGVSLSVTRGTLTGLIGPNGAGKSTLLSLLAGTEKASDGRISFQGQDVTGLPAYRRARIGLVRTFQLASEYKRLTVMENLLSAVPVNRGDSFAGALAGRWYWRQDEEGAIAKASALIEDFGLTAKANQYAGDLSGGQRRLVEIMRALMTEPDMLLLDEPMAGVHPELARRIGETLQELCRHGMTILMVEHELAIMDEFCDPVIVMAEGQVLATGTMAELRERSEVVEAYLVG